MTKDEALKLALRDLENAEIATDSTYESTALIRKALAQPEQEPVALPCCGYTDASAVKWNPFNNVVQCHNCGQVYTTPPQRKPLTDEKIKTLYAALKDVERTKGFSSENWFQAGLVMGEALHDIKENT